LPLGVATVLRRPKTQDNADIPMTFSSPPVVMRRLDRTM
jgi:hypothetical protein